jgi:hypothetical protein
VLSYLVLVILVYAAFLLARRQDRAARRVFAALLGALHRDRAEFWRLRQWARDARERGDEAAATELKGEASARLPAILRDSTALRRAYPEYTGEIGWMAGTLDDELAAMGRSLVSVDLVDCERWIDGSGRPSLRSVLHPPPAIGDDAHAGRVHGLIGAVVGAAGGWIAWVFTYTSDTHVSTATLALYLGAGALVVGYVASQVRETLWGVLARGIRRIGWGP